MHTLSDDFQELHHVRVFSSLQWMQWHKPSQQPLNSSAHLLNMISKMHIRLRHKVFTRYVCGALKAKKLHRRCVWMKKKQGVAVVACLSVQVFLITLMRQCPSTVLWRKKKSSTKSEKTTAFHISQHRRTTLQVNLSTSIHLTIKPHFKEQGNNEKRTYIYSV